MTPTITVHVARPDVGPGRAALRGYAADVVGRMRGVPATGSDVDDFLAGGSTSDLEAPDGLFLLARDGDPEADPDAGVLGCTGLRFRGPGVPDDAVEIKRMWTDPAARGRGVGRRLLAEVLRRAREAGAARVVLDSRADLVEARTLYERAGFVAIEPYNDNPHAQVWYALDLSS